MKTLIENLYHNNVIFSYYGFIDHAVLKEVLLLTKSKLESFNESNITANKIDNLIRNCVDNIIRFNFFPPEQKLHYKSLLIISKQIGFYQVDTICIVNTEQKAEIEGQLSFLHLKTLGELQALKMKQVEATNSGSHGNGFMDLVLKADAYSCSFNSEANNILFNINFKVDSKHQNTGTIFSEI
jgi:hypothetical protein